ncbi:P-loop containing nucleoside triphosphate hydrolase protein [Pavlovales sp. CCMP2436]|nr:P-loop containing nucleoside triphosphate hydrolase protein [Pavlovales sp. CCMP2436]
MADDAEDPEMIDDPKSNASMLKGAAGAVIASSAIEKAGAPPSSVMVAVRVRPQNAREIAQQEANCIDVGPDGSCIIIKPGEEDKKYTFSFDYSYNDDTDQAIVYDNLGAPILAKAFQGWNGTIFAYGQTGTGKSFSMTGTADKRGIIPQMNNDLFRQVSLISAAEPGREFLVTCSFMEIYNEVLYDLLDPSVKKGTSKDRKSSHLDIHEHPTLGVIPGDAGAWPSDDQARTTGEGGDME